MKRKYDTYDFYFSFFNGKGTLTAIQTVGNPSYFSVYQLTDGSIVKVHLIDTSGQEQYKAINERYYKVADCCLLVYDVTNKTSFDECKDYYNKNLIEKCKKEVKVILLGNKTDLEDKRVIKSEEGAGFALENDYIFMETSCLKNTNVANAFETLIELTNIEAKKNNRENYMALNGNRDKSHRKSCCS